MGILMGRKNITDLPTLFSSGPLCYKYSQLCLSQSRISRISPMSKVYTRHLSFIFYCFLPHISRIFSKSKLFLQSQEIRLRQSWLYNNFFWPMYIMGGGGGRGAKCPTHVSIQHQKTYIHTYEWHKLHGQRTPPPLTPLRPNPMTDTPLLPGKFTAGILTRGRRSSACWFLPWCATSRAAGWWHSGGRAEPCEQIYNNWTEYINSSLISWNQVNSTHFKSNLSKHMEI